MTLRRSLKSNNHKETRVMMKQSKTNTTTQQVSTLRKGRAPTSTAKSKPARTATPGRRPSAAATTRRKAIRKPTFITSIDCSPGPTVTVTTTKATVTTTVPGCECLKIWMVPVVHQDFWHIYVWPERDGKIAGGTRTYTRREHDFTEEEAVQSVIEEYLGARGPQPDITSVIGDWSLQLDERTEAP